SVDTCPSASAAPNSPPLPANILGPERQHTLPSQLGYRAVVHLPLFVHKAVLGIVAENLRVLASCPQARLKLVHRRRRAPIVPLSKMTLQRYPDVAWLGDALRRQPVEADRGGKFRHPG